MLLPSPAFRLLSVRYLAEVASWRTASREMSLLDLPLAATRSLYRPWVVTLDALLKNPADIRLVLEV